MDQHLHDLELRLEELGVDDLTIGAFIGVWNGADSSERSRLRALADRRLLREVAALKAATHVRADAAALVDQETVEHVAEGSGREIMAWVLSDDARRVDRARLALTAEEQRERPRTTVVAGLLKIVEGE